jgi:hypothetical protein
MTNDYYIEREVEEERIIKLLVGCNLEDRWMARIIFAADR